MSKVIAKATRRLRHRGIQVMLILAVYLLSADFLPLKAHHGLYTISVFIKDLLLWALPVTVGLFIAHTICSFQQKAPLFILSLLLFEALSNFASVWYAFSCGHIATDVLPTINMPDVNLDFATLWRLPINTPVWWTADKGMIIGLLVGCCAAVTRKQSLIHVISVGKEIAQWILTRVFSRLIPLFILGFVARMYQTHLLQRVFAHYGVLFVWLIVFLAIYITFLFLIGSEWSPRKTIQAIKNLMPAGGIAFTSGCSLSTMPWTIDGAGKNLQNPSFAKAIIPSTTNIQQIGDCITNTFLCFLIYRQFFGVCPDFLTWLNFSVVFVLARFTTAAVIGGAIFIMLPIYESYLSFNTEMIAIILAFNVILDPIVTSCNVIANGALCRIFEKVWLAVLNTTKSDVQISLKK
jgi:hypothetical protein